MKVILLSVLGTLALGSLSGISISNKDNGKLTGNKLNANYNLDNDPYVEYRSVAYEVDPEKQTYFTGHGNPDWYRIEDEVQVTGILAGDLSSVEYLNTTNLTSTTFFNEQIEFSKYSSSFSISIAAYTPLTEGQIVINYRFHNSAKFTDPYPDSYYSNDIDDSINELPPIYRNTSESELNDTYVSPNIVNEIGYITGKIKIHEGFELWAPGVNRIDQDIFRFTTYYKCRYTFNFTAPNNAYKFQLFTHENVGKTAKFTIRASYSNTAASISRTLNAGTYYMRVTCDLENSIRDSNYTIDYNREKPENEKLLLKQHVIKNYKMAVWNNDILSDVLPDKFSSNSYYLNHKEFGLFTFNGYESGYTDPVLTYNEPILDSLLVIWDKNICYGLRELLKQENIEFLKKLSADDLNERAELAVEIGAKGIEYILKIGGVVFKTVKAVSKVIPVVGEIISVCEIVVDLVTTIFRHGYTETKRAYVFGGWRQSLYDAADDVFNSTDPNAKMYIPIYGTLRPKGNLEYRGPSETNIFGDLVCVLDGYWEREFFVENLLCSVNPENNKYYKKCISQYQTIQNRDDSSLKTTYHGSIELLSNADEILDRFDDGFVIPN